MKWWYKHFSDSLPNKGFGKKERLIVEYFTGCVPLLLRDLLQFQGQPFNECLFLSSDGLQKVTHVIVEFYQKSQEERTWPAREKMFFSIMGACLRGDKITKFSNRVFDHRYFYVTKDHIAHCNCGVAFQVMAGIVREHEFSAFSGPQWYSTVELSSSNPVVQGFLVENVCLSRIAADGLRVIDERHSVFHHQPNWQNLLSSDHTHRLYIPTDFNFQAVDGAILLLDRAKKIAYLFLLQITLSLRHKDSEETFYTEMWRKWTTEITEAGFSKIHTKFVWIDKKQPNAEAKPGMSSQGTTQVHPKCESVHIGVVDVDPKLEYYQL